MANHSFQHLLSSPDVLPSPFPQHPSHPPLENMGHYNPPSLRHPIQNSRFLREFSATPYSPSQSRTNLHQIPAQSSMPGSMAYGQPTSRIGFSSPEAYAQPTPRIDFPSPGIGLSSGRNASLRDNSHQPQPDITQRFQPVNSRHYAPGSFSSGYNLPPRSDFSAVTSQQGYLGSSQRGALQWKETVICSNVDVSKLHSPPPPHLTYSSPPTQNSG
ncbi:MAG: hypothetical protein NXY57DRAFT_965871 [Lentinula lateritia]|nr:MAG: hypothetical protein NXY57DRAFT_965871 [Lentinula lateritia]